jgi:hypothetical protein
VLASPSPYQCYFHTPYRRIRPQAHRYKTPRCGSFPDAPDAILSGARTIPECEPRLSPRCRRPVQANVRLSQAAWPTAPLSAAGRPVPLYPRFAHESNSMTGKDLQQEHFRFVCSLHSRNS